MWVQRSSRVSRVASSQLLSQRFISKTKRRKILQESEEEAPKVKFKVPRPEDRRIYAWGLAETGALGCHKNLKKHASRQCLFVQHPTRIQFAEQFDVTSIAAGYGFSLYTTRNEGGVSVFGTGINTDSQLGLQMNKWRHSLERLTYPAPISVPHEALKCAAGRAHSLILTDKGVYALGNNSYGQCGRPVVRDESYSASSVVHLVPLGDKIVDVFCGQDHSLFLTDRGRLYACGWGADGQLGLGSYDSESRPKQVRGDIEGEEIVKVACSGDCNLALSSKGEVFGWGNTEYGQLLPDSQQVNVPRHLEITKGLGKVVDVASGGSFCLLVNEAGDVFVWGYGILGLGPEAQHVVRPKLMPPPLFGRDLMNPEARVVKVASGLTHMAAINSAGDLYMWGKNKYGCLGFGHQKDQFFPFKVCVSALVVDVKCGPDHTLALCRAY